MYLKRGTKARLTLNDQTTIAGTIRFSLPWWSWQLTDVTVYGQHGGVTAAGTFIVPKRSVLFVQVGE